MSNTKYNILKLIECFEKGKFNYLMLEINHLDGLWFFSSGEIKFKHWTGFDSESLETIDNICSNKYASNLINKNIDELVRKINLFAEMRKERSIL